MAFTYVQGQSDECRLENFDIINGDAKQARVISGAATPRPGTYVRPNHRKKRYTHTYCIETIRDTEQKKKNGKTKRALRQNKVGRPLQRANRPKRPHALPASEPKTR